MTWRGSVPIVVLVAFFFTLLPPTFMSNAHSTQSASVSHGFETDSTEGWVSTTPIPQLGIEGVELAVSTDQAYQGQHSLAISYGGALKYGLDGPNPLLIQANQRFEVFFYVPVESNVTAISFYTMDQSLKWDDASRTDKLGIVHGKWFRFTYRANAERQLPYRKIGFQFVTSNSEPGTIYVDTIQTVAPTLNSAIPFRALGRGMNIANALEFPRLKSINGKTEAVTLNREHFQFIQRAGFDFVRIPMAPHNYTLPDAPYTVDTEYLKRLDWVIKTALSAKLSVILDFHQYEELLRNPEAHTARFIAIWKQLAERYAKYSNKLYFELLNEPANELTAERWNSILNATLSEIRKTNRSRHVIVGPVAWNGIPMLNALQLPPADRRILVTFHFYDPMTFTHQGAEWVTNSSEWLGNRWLGTELEKYRISDMFDEAVEWSRTNNRSLLLGEFGAYSKATMEDRVRWTTFVRETSEARNIPWTYWDFFDGFGIFNQATGMLIDPLWRSLIPAPKVTAGAGFNQSFQFIRSPLYGFDEMSREGWHASNTPPHDEGKLRVSVDNKRKQRGSGALKLSYNQPNDVLTHGEKQKFALNGFYPQRLQPSETLEMWVWLPKTTNIIALQPFTMDNKWSWRDRWIDTSQTNFKKGAWSKISLTITGEAEFKKYGLLIHTKDGMAGDLWLDSVHFVSATSNSP